MSDLNAMNTAVIAEFRANDGVVGGGFASNPLVLINTVGAKTKTTRTTPLVYLPDGEDWIIFASFAGAPKNPAWFHNIKSQPDITIEVGASIIEAHASEVVGPERDELFAKQAETLDEFAKYAEATDRVIPVIRLTRR